MSPGGAEEHAAEDAVDGLGAGGEGEEELVEALVRREGVPALERRQLEEPEVEDGREERVVPAMEVALEESKEQRPLGWGEAGERSVGGEPVWGGGGWGGR